MQKERTSGSMTGGQHDGVSGAEVSDMRKFKTGIHAGFDTSLMELSLPELIRRANDLHSRVMQGVRATLLAAKDCGMALVFCKKKMGHGNWTAWLEENFVASEYTAQRYMRIARDWHLLETSGWLDGPDLPGIAMADEMIRDLHGGQNVPTSNISPPPTLDELLKQITGTIKCYVKAWPDEAITFLDCHILDVIDSIEAYVQKQLSEVQNPDVLPRIAIREHTTLRRLKRIWLETNRDEQRQFKRWEKERDRHPPCQPVNALD